MLTELPLWQQKEWVSQTELQSIMMRLRWASEVVFYVRYYLNSGFALLRRGQRAHGNIHLSAVFKADMRVVETLLEAWEPVPLLWADEWMKGASTGWASDAAKLGFGGWMVLDGVWYVFQGKWTREEVLWLHINALEMAGLIFSSAVFCPLKRGLRKIVDSNNKPTVDVINMRTNA